MLGKVFGSCVYGIDGLCIEVEVDIAHGLPAVHVVGLPDSAVRESVDRVRSAIKNCGFQFPMDRITVNLAPADVKKAGTAFDLAIAVGILLASNQLSREGYEHTMLIGELALDGSLRAIPGILSMVDTARKLGFKQVIVPTVNSTEARWIQGISVLSVGHLSELTDWQQLRELYERQALSSPLETDDTAVIFEDYSDVVGQQHAKRALMIAASGMHNLLFIGPPGSGKTMLLRRLPTILPRLAEAEALDVMKIYSVAGRLKQSSQPLRLRPFRAPHHTISAVGLIGGGSIPKPGEVSLAHRGVLFLDELPEFHRTTLEVLRQPLEDREVTIGRARGTCTFPSHFMLVGAMNPCPCGYWGDLQAAEPCSCTQAKILNYRGRISGPLLDRMDMHVEVPRGSTKTAPADPLEPWDSAYMFRRVARAHAMQSERYRQAPIRFNSELTGRWLKQYCPLPAKAEALLQDVFHTLRLSLRAYDRIVKTSRTIADLEGAPEIQLEHIAEALQYRCLDKKL